jgi:hypothetical protein
MWLYGSNEKASRTQNQSHLPAIQIATNHARILLSYITAKVERWLASRCSRLFCLFFPIRYQKRGDKREQLLPTPVTPLLLFSLPFPCVGWRGVRESLCILTPPPPTSYIYWTLSARVMSLKIRAPDGAMGARVTEFCRSKC